MPSTAAGAGGHQRVVRKAQDSLNQLEHLVLVGGHGADGSSDGSSDAKMQILAREVKEALHVLQSTLERSDYELSMYQGDKAVLKQVCLGVHTTSGLSLHDATRPYRWPVL